MSTEVKEQKKRRVRRNYEKELSTLETYVRVSVDVIGAIEPSSDFLKGQHAALQAVLARIEKRS